MVIILTAVAMLIIIMNVSGIKAKLTEDALDVKGPLFHQEINLSEMKEVSLKTDINYGRRTFGVDVIWLKTGSFKNNLFGEYQCAVYNTVKSAIVVEKNDGTFVVFNLNKEQATQELFESIPNELKTK